MSVKLFCIAVKCVAIGVVMVIKASPTTIPATRKKK